MGNHGRTGSFLNLKQIHQPKRESKGIYFKAENLVLRARSESVGFAEIVNKDRMVGTKAQSKNQKTILNNKPEIIITSENIVRW